MISCHQHEDPLREVAARWPQPSTNCPAPEPEQTRRIWAPPALGRGRGDLRQPTRRRHIERSGNGQTALTR